MRTIFQLPSARPRSSAAPRMDAPNEFQPMIDEIFRDKVRWARQESPERKFMDGLELFEEALVRMRGGIRAGVAIFAQFLRRRVVRRSVFAEKGEGSGAAASLGGGVFFERRDAEARRSQRKIPRTRRPASGGGEWNPPMLQSVESA